MANFILIAGLLCAISVIVILLQSDSGSLSEWNSKTAVVSSIEFRRNYAAPRELGNLLKALPLRFEENRGQTNSAVKFFVRAAGSSLFLTTEEAVLAFGSGTHSSVIRMKPLGANPAPSIIGVDELPTKSNYFAGPDPSNWRTNIPSYAQVRYDKVYPGIDLVYHGDGGQLEYDWIIHPGADPEQIRLSFSEAEQILIDEGGDLVVVTAAGEVRNKRPVAFQDSNGTRNYVDADFRLVGKDQVAFRLAKFDQTLALVIDPTLQFTALLGGTLTIPNQSGPPTTVNPGAAISISLDAAENVYMSLRSGSPDFPDPTNTLGIGSGSNRFFVLKVNASGTGLDYLTEIGGVISGGKIAVDPLGNAYVTGSAVSGFPITPGSFQTTLQGPSDAFIAKLDPSGSALVYSTFLGGSGSEGTSGIALDSAGNAYVSGGTFHPPDFPKTSAALQTCSSEFGMFVTKLNAEGTGLVYSACLDVGLGNGVGAAGIAVDSTGSAYLTGTTNSGLLTTPGSFQPNFSGGDCGTGPCNDGFVRKLDPSGSFLVYSTYLGGFGIDRASAIAVDEFENAHVCGYTSAGDFPTRNPIQASFAGGTQDAFIAKLNASGSDLIYSTYLGGNTGGGVQATGDDFCADVAVGSDGSTYVTGSTESFDFPLVNPILASLGGGALWQRCLPPFPEFCADAFVAKIDSANSTLVYSTYFGSGGNDFGSGIAVDDIGNAYVAGTWHSNSLVFPTLGTVHQTNGVGGAFLFKLSEAGTTPLFTAQSVTNGASFLEGLGFGAIATVFGKGITNVSGIVTATSLPLPTEIEGSSVSFNGMNLPLFAVANVNGQEQINFQVPSDLDNPAVMIVRNNGTQSLPIALGVFSGFPGIFTTDGSRGAIQHGADFRLVTPSDPAGKSEAVVIYATGLGRVEPDPGLGNPASSSPLSVTTNMPSVTVGGYRQRSFFQGWLPAS